MDPIFEKPIALSTAPRVESIQFDDWRARIQMATDVDQLMRVVRAYLAAWRPEQLRQLPWDLAATALCNSEDIVSRAVIASRLELKLNASEHGPLREMSLTLAAAATRLRYLNSLRSLGC